MKILIPITDEPIKCDLCKKDDFSEINETVPPNRDYVYVLFICADKKCRFENIKRFRKAVFTIQINKK